MGGSLRGRLLGGSLRGRLLGGSLRGRLSLSGSGRTTTVTTTLRWWHRCRLFGFLERFRLVKIPEVPLTVIGTRCFDHLHLFLQIRQYTILNHHTIEIVIQLS